MNRHITVKNILDIVQYTEDVDAVIFDLDDTLYSETENVRENIKNVITTHGCPEYEEEIFDEFKKGWAYLGRFMDNHGFTDETKKSWVNAYITTKPNLTPYPGVPEMLEELLRRGKRLGMITDGRPEAQSVKLESLGIARYFEKIIITDSIGGYSARKPNPVSFHMIQEYFGIPFKKMMYVGDNPEKDVPPAVELGMRSVHFDNDESIYKLHRNIL